MGNVSEETTYEGTYIKVGTDVFGVLSSAGGKELVYNQDRYSLDECCWDVELVIGKKTHLFIFYWKGEMKISLRYNKHYDFFLWLYGLLRGRTQAEPLQKFA